MARTSVTRTKLSPSTGSKIIIDTFAGDGWTKSSSGSAGSWSVDSSDQYNGHNTLKLVTAGGGTGSSDYATKDITAISYDLNSHYVFEVIVKTSDVNRFTRFYINLYKNATAYYELQLETTGNKYGFNNEYTVYRASLHGWFNSVSQGPVITKVRFRVSDSGSPITVRFGEMSYYRMPKLAYICFTNDDGNKSGYDFFHSVLKPLGIKGTLFPSSENITSGQGGNTNYMNHANVLQLEADGFEIGIHGESGNVGKTGTTISFDSASKEIRDSSNGFITGGFLTGQFISVTGSTKNNSKYTISNVTAGVITVLETLVDETAGASVSVVSEGFSIYQNGAQLQTYIDTQKNYLRNTVGCSSSLTSLAYPNGEFGKDSTSFPYSVCNQNFTVCRVTTLNTPCLIPENNKKIQVGRSMYLSNSFTESQIITSINNLLETGGIGVIISHDLKEAASSAYNFNLTNATNIANYIGNLINQGKLIPITFGQITSLPIKRNVVSSRSLVSTRLLA